MSQALVVDVPHFSQTERDQRWRKVREAMRREKIDAIFVPPNTGFFDQFQANVRYLTGIGGNCAMAGAIFSLEGEVTALTNPDVDTEFWMQRQSWITDVRPGGSGWGYADASVDRLRELHLEKGRIGVTGLSGNTRYPEGVTSLGIYNRLRELMPDADIVNANMLMEQVRFVKSEEEIAFISKANELVYEAIDVVVREAKPGVPENVVYARMIASMVEGGGELPTMILWSAGWPQPPSNQYMPSRRPLCTGDAITMECEARWGGYVGQNTQQFFVGKVPDDYKRMFALQQEATAKCYENIHPGKTLGDIAEVAASFTNKEFQCKLIMHCRGLGDDSPMCIYTPRDATMRDWKIEENSTFIVKPVIQTPDNSKRVYWGDMIAATATGARRLGRRPASIIEI